MVISLAGSTASTLPLENEEQVRLQARKRLEEQLLQYRVKRQQERVSLLDWSLSCILFPLCEFCNVRSLFTSGLFSPHLTCLVSPSQPFLLCSFPAVSSTCLTAVFGMFVILPFPVPPLGSHKFVRMPGLKFSCERRLCWGWRDGTGYSSRASVFDSQHQHDSSRSSVTPYPRHPSPSSDLQGHQACTWYTAIHMNKTLKNEDYFKKRNSI